MKKITLSKIVLCFGAAFLLGGDVYAESNATVPAGTSGAGMQVSGISVPPPISPSVASAAPSTGSSSSGSGGGVDGRTPSDSGNGGGTGDSDNSGKPGAHDSHKK